MAVVSMTGFETGDLSESGFTTGTLSISSSVFRTGAYALRVNPATSGTGYLALTRLLSNGQFADTFSGDTNFYVTFYLRVATAPASNNEEILTIVDADSSIIAQLRLDSNRKLSLYANTTSVAGPSSTALTLDTWHCIELYIEKGTNGDYELKIDKSSQFTGTHTFTSFNIGYCYIGKVTNRNSQSIDVYYDDFVVSNSGFFTGDVHIKRLAPTGNGTYTAWTGTYTDVDEVPPNGNTDYVNTSTSGNAESVELEDTATVGISGTVHAVAAVASVGEASNVTSAFQVRLRSNTTDNDTTSYNGFTTYATLEKIHNTDPNGGGAWTTSAVDGIQVGIEANSNVVHRCSALMAMVLYEPPAPATGNRRRRFFMSAR